MSKVKFHSVPKEERYQIIGEFFDIIHFLRTKQEIIDFFIGLLTTSESLMMARRIQVAKLIIQEKKYEEIRKELKVSYQTIQKVERWLHERDGAYLKVLRRYFKKTEVEDKRQQQKKYQPERLLNRYPQHRLLRKILGI